MSIGLSLIAIVLGYRMLVDSRKEKKGWKQLGLALGTFVIVIAFLSSLCVVLRCGGKSGMSCPTMKSGCPIQAKMAECVH